MSLVMLAGTLEQKWGRILGILTLQGLYVGQFFCKESSLMGGESASLALLGAKAC